MDDFMDEDIEMSFERDYWQGQELVRNILQDEVVDEYLEELGFHSFVTQEEDGRFD